jgi:hypothetical protein
VHGVSKVETTTHACAFSAAFSTFNFAPRISVLVGLTGVALAASRPSFSSPQNHQTERRQMKPFQRTPMFARITSTVAATLLAAGCRDATAPNAHSLRPAQPAFAVSGASAETQGTGSIGTGTASPGSSRQDFDFDIKSDLSGHLTLTDWSVVRSATTVASLTVSESDQGTWFSAFRDGSAACADPTHGVEIDGNGRLDTGQFLQFTIYICDNGPAGSAADFIRFYAPNGGPYDRSGNLSSGDLVKSGTVAPTRPDARIAGVGAIGTGTATPGNNRQDFDFDANATPGGRIKFTDYSHVMSDGNAEFLVVDPVNDPATGVTSFQQTSASCVRFGGTSRVDGGGTFLFYVDACDNASSGTGFDTFTITVPDADGVRMTYRSSGTLSSGDIAFSGSSTPTTGTLNVTTSTTGANLDPDGYTVAVDGGNSTSIADNGNQSFSNLSSGSHTVTLSGVAANCAVSGGSSQSATVPAGGSASVSFQVTCVAPPATQLAFTVQPNNATAGSAISPAVQVTARDASGNVSTSFSGSITIALGSGPSGGTLSGTMTMTAVNGVATFSNLMITRAGAGYTLTAAASGLTGATSASFSVSAASASALLFTVQPSTTQTSTSISPAVQVTARDAYGNTATSFNGSMTMAIGQNPGGGTLSGTKTVTAVNGVGTFSDLKIDRAGSGYTLRVSGAGPGAESAQFNVAQKPLICVLGICIG